MHNYLKANFRACIFVSFKEKKRMATFSLNDESKYNSYGFRVPNAGLMLDRFRENPVMLDDHYNSTAGVVGRWNNIRVEDGHLKADDDFDMEDDRAKTLKGKVDRGFIKGASLGLVFDRDKMQVDASGRLVLTEAEVLEGSIVPIPANAGAIRLYAKDTHKLLSEADIKLSLSAFKNTNSNTEIKNDNMNKIVLSAIALTALGIQSTEDNAAFTRAVEELAANYNAEKTARAALTAKFEKQAKDQAEALVNDAIAAGKLSADLKDQFVQMATANYELAAKVIGAMPGKKSLAAQVQNTEAKEIKSMDDFQKLSVEKQLAFKAEHPEEYAALA